MEGWMSGGLRHYWDWLWIPALLSILIAYVLWYLQHNPNFIYSFAIAFSVALVLCAVLVLRYDLIRRLLGLYKRDLERGGWFYRYGRLAAILFIINSAIFRLMLQFQLVSPQYPYFVLAFFYIQMALGMVLVVSFLKVAGKWWRYPIITMLILTLVIIAIITAMFLFIP